MKKLLGTFVLLSCVLSQAASASAVLTWVSTPDVTGIGTKTLDADGVDNGVLTADITYSKAFSGDHSWVFNLAPASGVLSEFAVLFRDGLFDHATLDGLAINNGDTRSLASGNHTLELFGIVAHSGTHEDITLSAVPLPGAAILFGSALVGGVGGLRRKKRAVAESEAVLA